MRDAGRDAGEVIGELHGGPDAILAGAKAILASVSPLGRVSLVGRELVFETRSLGRPPCVETLPAADGLPCEVVRHVAARSCKAAMPRQWLMRAMPVGQSS